MWNGLLNPFSRGIWPTHNDPPQSGGRGRRPPLKERLGFCVISEAEARLDWNATQFNFRRNIWRVRATVQIRHNIIVFFSLLLQVLKVSLFLSYPPTTAIIFEPIVLMSMVKSGVPSPSSSSWLAGWVFIWKRLVKARQRDRLSPICLETRVISQKKYSAE